MSDSSDSSDGKSVRKKAKNLEKRAAQRAAKARKLGLRRDVPAGVLSVPSGVDIRGDHAEYLTHTVRDLLRGELTSVDLEGIEVEIDAVLGPLPGVTDLGRYTRTLYGNEMYDKLVRAPASGEDAPKGAPRVLVVCPGGQRSADVIREIGTALKLKEKAARGTHVLRIGKLFSKHFKLAQQTQFLARTVLAVGVGTPNRLSKLIEASDGLCLDRLEYVLLDASRDVKDRTLFDMNEVCKDVARLLRVHVFPLCREGRVKIGVLS